MKQDIDHKVPGGKLIRLSLDLEDKRIRSIKLTGDFFIHPETAIAQIEATLTGVNVDDVNKVLRECIQKNSIVLIGFGVEDVAEIINQAIWGSGSLGGTP